MCFFSVQLSKGMNKQNRSTCGVRGWAGGCGEGCGGCYQHPSVFGMGELMLWVPTFSLLFYGCALGIRFSSASDVSPLQAVTIIRCLLQTRAAVKMDPLPRVMQTVSVYTVLEHEPRVFCMPRGSSIPT